MTQVEQQRPSVDLGLCDVCGKEPAIGVASSFIPVSFAYGRECLRAGLEPYGACVMRLLGSGVQSRDEVSEEMGIRSTIDRSLAFHGKTWDVLLADVKEGDDRYEG